MKFSKHWFTIAEFMVVISIIGILASAVYVGMRPYMMRSRDTKRITDIQNYMNNIIVTYSRNFDAFPSNYWSGWDFNERGYCLNELTARPWDIASDHVHVTKKEGHFSAFQVDTSRPPVDPSQQMTYSTLCNMTGSYIYSQIKYGRNSQVALIAAQLEIKESANYGTGVDLTDSWKVSQLIQAKKSSLPPSAPNQFFIVTALSE